jgi:pyruvate/oxaloacetate carboxyltransferase
MSRNKAMDIRHSVSRWKRRNHKLFVDTHNHPTSDTAKMNVIVAVTSGFAMMTECVIGFSVFTRNFMYLSIVAEALQNPVNSGFIHYSRQFPLKIFVA